MTTSEQSTAQRHWYIVGRWQEFEGESRVNQLRILAAMGLAWLQAHGCLRGQLIKLYLIMYLAYRFGSEWLRPEPQWLAGLTGYQWAALAMLPIFAGLWLRYARQFREDRLPANPPLEAGSSP